jgi:SAM-dependent methyltransferase
VTERETVDIEAVMAQVRERVREKRAKGIYDEGTAALLRTPLPGGAPLVGDEQTAPLKALPTYLGTEIVYDPRSHKPLVGPLITFARRTIMWLLRWWMHEAVARQDRVNRLIIRQLELLESRSAPQVDARLAQLESAWRERLEDESAAELDWLHFADRFGGAEELVRQLYRQFVLVFSGRSRVLDLGSGRGTFLELLKAEGIGAYGVDRDRHAVELCRARRVEVLEADGLAHLRSLAAASLDGLFAAHFAEHVEPGYLLKVLREARRALRPGSPAVFVTPNAENVSVGAHTFWRDPSHRRPVPPDLFRYYLETAGFVEVQIRTYSPVETRLSEEVPPDASRENIRLLNATLFGDRDCALIARVPG